MANRWAVGAVVVTLLGVGVSDGQAQPDPTFVVHLTDHEHVPADDLAHAKALAAQVYQRIGVQLVWASGSAKLAPADGRLHIDASIMNTEQTAHASVPNGVVGLAGHTTKRAYIYYPRVVAEAMKHGDDSTTALALVLAHEIGHVVLPEYSHTSSGLMRAEWGGERMVKLPDFLPNQATMIRQVLAPIN